MLDMEAILWKLWKCAAWNQCLIYPMALMYVVTYADHFVTGSYKVLTLEILFSSSTSSFAALGCTALDQSFLREALLWSGARFLSTSSITILLVFLNSSLLFCTTSKSLLGVPMMMRGGRAVCCSRFSCSPRSTPLTCKVFNTKEIIEKENHLISAIAKISIHLKRFSQVCHFHIFIFSFAIFIFKSATDKTQVQKALLLRASINPSLSLPGVISHDFLFQSLYPEIYHTVWRIWQ